MKTPRRLSAVLTAACLAGALAFAQEPPPPPPPGPPHPPAAPGPLPERKEGGEAKDNMVRQAIDHLRRERPARFEELMNLRRANPKAFEEELRNLVQQWRERHPKERAPTLPEELRARELSWRYHDSHDEAERDKLRAELAEAVEQAFQARVKIMEKRLETMEKELDTFRQRLEQLKANREPICKGRTEELLRPPELNWEGGGW